MSGQIDRDHAIPLDERGQHSTSSRSSRQTVHQQQWLPLAADVILERSSSLVSRVVAAVIRAKYPSLTMATLGTRAR